MRWVTCQSGKLSIDDAKPAAPAGLRAAGPLELERGHVHELLTAGPPPVTVAAWLAAAHADGKGVVWCGSGEPPYAPALAAMGVRIRDFYAVRSTSAKHLQWAANEAARCTGVGVTIMRTGELRMTEARRLQLSAERGGGLLLLLRHDGPGVHAARSRWLVDQVPGEGHVRRWRMTLRHDRGGRAGETVLLEHDREMNTMREAGDVAAVRLAAARG